jgi:hypothetical protein
MTLANLQNVPVWTDFPKVQSVSSADLDGVASLTALPSGCSPKVFGLRTTNAAKTSIPTNISDMRHAG